MSARGYAFSGNRQEFIAAAAWVLGIAVIWATKKAGAR